MNLNVLFYTYHKALKMPGGGEIQLLKTKEYLEKLGIRVEVSNDPTNFRKYDLVHFFSLSKDISKYIIKAKKLNIKTVISPIYWPMIEFALKGDLPFWQKVKTILKHMIDTRIQFLSYVKRMLDTCDMILPNSYTEASLIRQIFHVRKIFVVHNAADEKFLKAKPDEFVEKYNVEDFILNVGRIEPRKNQLKLLRAIKGMNIPLVLIGEKADLTYFELCKKYFYKIDVLHIPFLAYESNLLTSAYAAAKLFVLPSWYETPGLAALEAAMAGCNVVITDRGSTREYFKDYVWYVNPSDIKDIRRKIEEAYFSERVKRLKKFIATNYTWRNAANETLLAYKKILE